MTVNKFIRKLLNLKELVVCGFDFNERKRQLLIIVKPYKNGCRCLNVIVVAKSNIKAIFIGCGAIYLFMDVRLSCVIDLERFCASPMAGFKKISPGRIIIHESLTVSNLRCCILPNHDPKRRGDVVAYRRLHTVGYAASRGCSR